MEEGNQVWTFAFTISISLKNHQWLVGLFLLTTSLTCFLFGVVSRTGKTLLAKTLARFVNVPFVIADATTLTQAS